MFSDSLMFKERRLFHALQWRTVLSHNFYFLLFNPVLEFKYATVVELGRMLRQKCQKCESTFHHIYVGNTIRKLASSDRILTQNYWKMSECDAANPPTPINILGVSIYWNAFVTESSINKNGTRGTHFMHDAFFPSLFKCNPHLLLKEQERDQELKRRTILKKTASVTGSYVRMGSKKAPKVYYGCRVKSTKTNLALFYFRRLFLCT